MDGGCSACHGWFSREECVIGGCTVPGYGGLSTMMVAICHCVQCDAGMELPEIA